MKNIILLLTVVLTFSACKEQKNELALTKIDAMDLEKARAESEWISLFDGTNYDHWRG